MSLAIDDTIEENALEKFILLFDESVPVLMPFKLESFSNAAYYAFYILSAVAFF
jgi:hypothetical protein